LPDPVERESLRTVEEAAKTLLDLYASLRQSQSGEAKLREVVRKVGARQDEPYI
jgi:hypothetical protein